MRFAIRLSLLLILLAQPARAEDFVSARITGRVTDTAGQPLQAATVQWNRASMAKVDLTKPRSTTTDNDGRYELTLWFAKDTTLIVNEVFAEAEGYVQGESPADIPLRGGDAAKLDLRLERGEILAGTVRLPPLPTDGPSTKRMLLLSGPNFKTRTTNARLRLADANGRFKTYLPAGEYTLEVLGYGKEPVKFTGIKAGRDDVVLELQPFEWSETDVGRAFDDLWTAMDQSYSYFFLKTDVDWPAQKQKYRPQAVLCKSSAELVKVLQEMLAPLRDLHVWIQTPTGIVGTHQGSFAFNGNGQAILAQLVDRTDCGRFAIVGRTKVDGFGYFLMAQQSAANPDNVKQAVEAIQKLRDAPGFIVDLRSANGGNELLAQEIARQFCGQETVYAKHKVRGGPGHNEFGPEQKRVLAAATDAYTKPVVCLIGPGAVSSGEGFVKMMKCLPHVTTVGLPTRGASGNPKPHAVSRTGLTVYFSRWVDLMPDGQTFEGRGIPPDVEVKEPAGAYAAADPTLDKGLEVLRARVAKAQAGK